jgi:hypothetical protein
MISKVVKARIALVVIVALFTAPFIASWYLVFYTDFKKNDIGVQNGSLIHPVIEVGAIEAIAIGDETKQKLLGKWTLTGFVSAGCDADCEKLLYTLRQTRLALGKNLDKVGRLVLTDSDEVLGYEEEYKGQKVVKDPEEYGRLMNKFREIENFDASDVYLIDPYGFIMMRYDRSMNPKGIIKDVERLIKNSS